jgi:hypothetical protein
MGGTTVKEADRPHAFLERPDLPVAVPRQGTPAGPLLAAPASTVSRTGTPSCAVCGRPRSDRLHAQSEEEAAAERWPV